MRWVRERVGAGGRPATTELSSDGKQSEAAVDGKDQKPSYVWRFFCKRRFDVIPCIYGVGNFREALVLCRAFYLVFSMNNICFIVTRIGT